MKRIGIGVILTIVFLVLAVDSLAITLRVTGSWSRTVDAGDLTGPPGSDLNPIQESTADQVLLSIRQTNANWNIYVLRIDTNWNSGLRLYVRRTSEGSGPGNVTAGLSYQEVTGTDQTFFSGYRQRQNINIQLRLEGISVQIPADTYSTTVYYTVYEW